MLITENVSLHLNATSPLIAPNRHFCGKTFFMPVPRRACVPLVDVLLRILPGEVAVMAWLPQSRRAYLAVMPFWDVKTTGVTRVSIRKLLREVRVWGLNILSLGWWCKIPSTYGRRSHVPRCTSSCRERHDGWSTSSCVETRRAPAASAPVASSLSATSKPFGEKVACC